MMPLYSSECYTCQKYTDIGVSASQWSGHAQFNTWICLSFITFILWKIKLINKNKLVGLFLSYYKQTHPLKLMLSCTGLNLICCFSERKYAIYFKKAVFVFSLDKTSWQPGLEWRPQHCFSNTLECVLSLICCPRPCETFTLQPASSGRSGDHPTCESQNSLKVSWKKH